MWDWSMNGAMVTVIDICYHTREPPDLPIAVMVKFDHYSGPTFFNNTVPIPPLQRTWYTAGSQCSRLQVPLKLAWGVTIHKAQGLTLDKVVVNIGKKEFSSGLTFVACSRVRRITDLLFNPPFPFQRLAGLANSQRLQDRRQEDCRLRELERNTLALALITQLHTHSNPSHSPSCPPTPQIPNTDFLSPTPSPTHTPDVLSRDMLSPTPSPPPTLDVMSCDMLSSTLSLTSTPDALSCDSLSPTPSPPPMPHILSREMLSPTPSPPRTPDIASCHMLSPTPSPSPTHDIHLYEMPSPIPSPLHLPENIIPSPQTLTAS